MLVLSFAVYRSINCIVVFFMCDEQYIFYLNLHGTQISGGRFGRAEIPPAVGLQQEHFPGLRGFARGGGGGTEGALPHQS